MFASKAQDRVMRLAAPIRSFLLSILVLCSRCVCLFVTDGSDRSAFSVYPAARGLVAAPELHSNPFVDWVPREALRRNAVAFLAGAEDPTACTMLKPHRTWFLIPPTAAAA
jgi:hypothetical protein